MMRRRDFIAILGGATTGWPFAACAQSRRTPRVGVLMNGNPDNPANVHDAQPSYFKVFLEAFGKLGWHDGQNVQIDIRWTGN